MTANMLNFNTVYFLRLKEEVILVETSSELMHHLVTVKCIQNLFNFNAVPLYQS